MRPGLTIVTIPGAWYVTTELTGPADRGSQPAGFWTGLACAELELYPGEPVKSSVLEYLVDRFGGFDVIVASDRNRSAQHAQAQIAAQHAHQSGNTAAATRRKQGAADIWAALTASSEAALISMQRDGGLNADHRRASGNRQPPADLGHEWIVASFRHDTDDETGDPLLHIHNVVPTLTDRHWLALRNPGTDHATEPV